MQSEAGQKLTDIVRRKEVERRAGEGLFLWGVGNAPGSAAARLAGCGVAPEIVFSIMKGPPRALDANPPSTLVWRAFIGSDGVERPLPAHALVTSRGHGAQAGRRHYALICKLESPLQLGDHGPFNPGDFCNLGGAPVGASQVTALLRRVSVSDHGSYRVNMRASLVEDMWVRLSDPAPVSTVHSAALDGVGEAVGVDEWLDFVARVRETGTARVAPRPHQPSFL